MDVHHARKRSPWKFETAALIEERGDKVRNKRHGLTLVARRASVGDAFNLSQ